jgi:hypothetical protein
VGAAFFWNVRPLSTPASDPTITQAAIAEVGQAAAAVAAAATEPLPVPIGPIPQNVPTAQPSAAPTPSQGVPYNAAQNVPPPTRGGPITIAVNGNLLVSRHLQFGGNDAAGAAAGDESLGATIEVDRRTLQTSTRITFPSNLSATSQASLGAATAEYDTTSLSYLYGPQQISGLNLVPLGTTIRGFAVVSPLRKGGDVTLFSGPGQAGAQTFALNGLRLRLPVKTGFAGFTAFDAKVENGPGRTDGLTLGLASRIGTLQTGSEIVVERNNGFAQDASSFGSTAITNGIAYSGQTRIDAISGLNAASFTARSQGPNFVNVGSASAAASDAYGDLTLRHSSISGSSLQLDLSDERYVAGEATVSTHESLSYTSRIGQTGSGQLSLTNATGLNGDLRTWTGNAQFSYGATFRTLAVQANLAATRQTEDGLDPSGGYGFGLGFSKVLSPVSAANAFYTYQQQTSPSSGISSTGTLTLGLSRQFRKTNVLGQLSYSRSAQTGTDERSLQPSLTVSRRISPAITFNLGASGDFHRDILNPGTRSHTVGITASFGAPLAFGNGLVNGRVNPKLPAQITGFVAQDAAQSGLAAAQGFSLSSGVGNILIILDGTRSIRTDARGQFQFGFIAPGRHDIVVDPGSLPPGLTADEPSTTVVLSGGQTAHLALGIGTYGLIEGHVFGRDSKGAVIPVAQATVQLDDGGRAQTNAAGYYGFGRLLPGKHVVKIDLASVPANLSLPADAGKTVSVIPGQRIEVDFVGAPLGSITGALVYDGSFEPAENGKPVQNAYVVANPGDHAAIVDDYGRFIIDNLPAGTYEISVDEDTLPDDHGVVSQSPLEAVLAAGGTVDGLRFTVGSKPRNVIFSFKQGATNVLDVKVPLNPQPAGVGVPIVVTASEAATGVSVSGLGGKPVELTPNADKKIWRGTLQVSALARSGDIVLAIKATGEHPGDGSAKIRIDQNLQIAFFELNPARPVTNQYVHVKARFFTDIRKGDKIAWSDGATTVLGAPVRSIVSFDVKMSSVPYVGTLLSGGQLYRIVLRSK